MRFWPALSIALLLLLSGCSAPAFYWYQPDRTLEEAKADFTACRDQAHQKAGEVVGNQQYERLPPPDGPSAMKGKLEDQGRTAEDPRDTQNVWRRRYEQSVLNDSMRAKGYLRLRPDRIPRGVHTQKFPEGAVAGQ